MANRIMITADEVTISKPGVDVTTATGSDLLFDSRWGNGKVWSKGEVILAGGSGWKSIPYGRTFTTRPMIVFKWNGSVFMSSCSYWGATLYLVINCFNNEFRYIRQENPRELQYWILDWNL
ncbi:hypothetical protein [Mesorhizobium sp. M0843]|uniref:hypothetical protein n=1 Tax=Mesorhizobium sp. M0843 TaxID=2957010 RepID=UPI00333DE764